MRLSASAFAIACLLLAFLTGASPALAQDSEVVDFEYHPANAPGTPGTALEPDYYAGLGVRFSGGTVLRYEPGFASSGTNGIEMCYSTEFCTAPFAFTFDSGQTSVGVQVGYRSVLDAPEPVLMTAVDQDGQRIGAAEIVLGAGLPIPVEVELRIEDPRGRIRQVEVRWSNATRSMNSLVVDDVTFEPFVASPELVVDPDPLVFDATEENSTVANAITVSNIGNVPVAFFLDLDDPLDHFDLGSTTCSEVLVVGESCFITVELTSTDETEYAAWVHLRGPTGAPIMTVPVTGTLAISTPTTESTTASTTTESTTASTTTESTTGDTGGIAGWWIVALAAIVGGGVVFRGRWDKSGDPDLHVDSRPGAAIDVRVRPGVGSHRVVEDSRRPVVEIHISANPSETRTTMTEEEKPR